MFEKVRRGYQAGWKGRLLLPKRKGLVLDAGPIQPRDIHVALVRIPKI